MCEEWRVINCPKCRSGIDMTIAGSITGENPVECDCASGLLYIRPTGHVFLYPGGPARGRCSKEVYRDAKTTEEVRDEVSL